VFQKAASTVVDYVLDDLLSKDPTEDEPSKKNDVGPTCKLQVRGFINY
jgi:hypothetical protein